jgi:hypothetical protein
MAKPFKTIKRVGLFGDIREERAPGQYTRLERRKMAAIKRLNPRMSDRTAYLTSLKGKDGKR